MNQQTEPRFVLKTRRDGTCLRWVGAVSERDGYGRFWLGGRLCLAHRAAWILAHGDIDAGMNVLHHCDNRWCVEVGHLFLGTQMDNVRDMFKKGRNHKCKSTAGEANGRTRLKNRDVHFIRGLAEVGFTQSEIGAMYGLTQTGVSLIIMKKRWKNLEGGI